MLRWVSESSFFLIRQPKEQQHMRFNRPTEEQIRRRANQIFVKDYCQSGHDWENWLQAESELTQLYSAMVCESWANWSEKQRVSQQRTWSSISSFSCSSLSSQY
jgi:hypothetical protein